MSSSPLSCPFRGLMPQSEMPGCKGGEGVHAAGPWGGDREQSGVGWGGSKQNWGRGSRLRMDRPGSGPGCMCQTPRSRRGRDGLEEQYCFPGWEWGLRGAHCSLPEPCLL